MAMCHSYPAQKIYKGGHETPQCILLREHGGNMVSDFVVVIFHENVRIICGCGLRRQQVAVFYAKRDLFMLFLISCHSNVRISFGCGLWRQFCFVFYAKSDLFRLFLLLRCPPGQTVEAFWSKNNESH